MKKIVFTTAVSFVLLGSTYVTLVFAQVAPTLNAGEKGGISVSLESLTSVDTQRAALSII